MMFDCLPIKVYNMDARLKHKSAMIVAGPSQAGKTTFVESLIKSRDVMFDIAPRKVHWFTGTLYDSSLPDMQVYEGLPDSFDMVEPYDMIILDDLMMEAETSKAVSNLFTRLVHHLPCTVVSITQNLYCGGRENRTRSLNSQYIVLFKSPRDLSQITCLGKQMYPGKKGFLIEVYKDAINLHPHSYLFLDLHQNTPEELRLRSCVLPEEAPQRVYMPPNAINMRTKFNT